MFEILFASSSFILRLATLVKSAEVWVKDSFISETWFDVLWHYPSTMIKTFLSLFQIIFMEDKEE